MNGVTRRRLSEAAALLPLQVMGPALSELVFGPPGERRQWLDWGLFHVEHTYLEALRSYVHALRQRNAGLKAAAQGHIDNSELEAWTQEVARHGEEVSVRREAYVAAVTPHVAEALAEIAPGMALDVHYRRGWSDDQPLLKVLGDSIPREVKSGSTQSGPHRAELELRVAGLAAGTSLSRGQGKALASALILAQARLLQRDAARSSVFLIDDIGAELDLPHSRRLFGLLAKLGAQILATSNSGPAALQGLPDIQLNVFHVEHGRVAPEP